MEAVYDILGIGNAIVDIVAEVDEAFLSEYGMKKAAMTLIDEKRASDLTTLMPGLMTSGGSVANTCAVAAGLGSQVAYLGCVAPDKVGEAFRDDISRTGVYFPSSPAVAGPATGRCLIAVTPDGQRTMNTYLGACVGFSARDVDGALIAQSKVIYLEGYLFDPPAAQEAFRVAAEAARNAGRKVALSLSDAFCVDRHRAAFRELVLNQVDILFANEAELCSLYQANDLEDAIREVGQEVVLAVVTQGAEGSTILFEGQALRIPPAPAKVLDTTGAGDAYAAGFLSALCRGANLIDCGNLASGMAAAVIEHLGARPPRDLEAQIYARVKTRQVEETFGA